MFRQAGRQAGSTQWQAPAGAARQAGTRDPGTAGGRYPLHRQAALAGRQTAGGAVQAGR